MAMSRDQKCGILYRKVVLSGGWHGDAMGAMIGTLRRDGSVIAILPSNMGGYESSSFSPSPMTARSSAGGSHMGKSVPNSTRSAPKKRIASSSPRSPRTK